MSKVGLFSDTHNYLHPDLMPTLADCDQWWHAGDIGQLELLTNLQAKKSTRAVWGNIDDSSIRQVLPEDDCFVLGGATVLVSHIIGHPARLQRRAKKVLELYNPDLVIYGHSHLLRLDYDKKTNVLFVNPGAVGNHGDHLIRTSMTFELNSGVLRDLKVVEFGNRGAEPAGATKIVDLGDWPLRTARA